MLDEWPHSKYHVLRGASGRFHRPALDVALKPGRRIGFAAYDMTGRGRFGPTTPPPHYRCWGTGSALLQKCPQSMQTRGDARQ